jgi:class 3 adenylate cyclase
MHEAGASELEHAKASVDASEKLTAVPLIFGPLFLRQLEVAVERTRATQNFGNLDTFRLSVGFLDLVGYTEWSRGLTTSALAAAVNDFEGEANDRINVRGARMVKSIGDAVMFVARDAATACEIATDMCAFVDAHPMLTRLRGAVATGDVIGRDGDYVGPTVNLAARLVKEAEPGTIVSDVAVPGRSCVALGTRVLRGIDEPVELWRLSP